MKSSPNILKSNSPIEIIKSQVILGDKLELSPNMYHQIQDK